jgi:hypothetical protein
MKQLHEGLDYTLYKIYIGGGIAFYVVWVFVSTLVFDALSLPGPLPFFYDYFPSDAVVCRYPPVLVVGVPLQGQ